MNIQFRELAEDLIQINPRRACGVVHETAGSLRQAIEDVFAAVSGDRQDGTLHRSGVFAALCVAFGLGAGVGAYATKGIPDLALGAPVVALLIVLLRCDVQRNEGRL